MISNTGGAHIKFWKMAKTFTGLKLQGELGRFGKTEFSDILGVLPMPDEKVTPCNKFKTVQKVQIEFTGRFRLRMGEYSCMGRWINQSGSSSIAKKKMPR